MATPSTSSSMVTMRDRLPSKASKIQRIMRSSRQELEDAESSLQRALADAEKLKKKIRTLNDTISACIEKGNPTSGLPPEVLAHIFLLALPSLEDHFETQYTDPLYLTLAGGAPWTVSAVCKQWREVAVSNATLWSDVCILAYGRCGETDVDQTRQSLLTAVKLQIRRSAQTQLKLTIRNPSVTNRYHISKLKPQSLGESVIRYLSKHAHRFQYLVIPSHLRRLFTGPFPSLSHIVYNNFVYDEAFDRSLEANQLRHLEVTDVTAKNMNTFPWKNIISLKIRHRCEAGPFFIQVAPQFQNTLVGLHLPGSFHGVYRYPADNAQTSVASLLSASPNGFTFASLKTLTLGGDFSYYLSPFLTTPALEVLIIPRPHERFEESIEGLIRRSSCSLTSLIVGDTYRYASQTKLKIPVYTLVSFLSNATIVNNLRELYVRTDIMADAIFDAVLSSVDRRVTVYANLETLILKDMKVKAKPLLGFLENVHATAGRGGNLKFFRMESMRHAGKEAAFETMQPQLERLRAKKFEIELSTKW